MLICVWNEGESAMHATATEEQAVDTKLITARQRGEGKPGLKNLFQSHVLQQLDKRGDRYLGNVLKK